MALLRDMYALANYVYDIQDTNKKLIFHDDNMDDGFREYGRRKNILEKEALYIGASAVEDGFVTDRLDRGDNDGRRKIIVLKGGKGKRFIETGPWEFPTGLVKAWMEANHLLTNLLWIVIGVVLGNAGTIIDFISKHI